MRSHGVGRVPEMNRRTPSGSKDPGEGRDLLDVNLRTFDRQMKFEIHHETGRLIVRVVDPETSEILREIPAEEILNLVARMQVTTGFLLDLRM